MVSEELLTYIRENTLQGFSRKEIEIVLRGAGWTEPDIISAFTTASSAPARGSNGGMSVAQRSSSDELARIQEELRVDSARRLAVSAATESGVIGMIIKTKIVSSKRDALILIGAVCFVVLGLVYWFFLR